MEQGELYVMQTIRSRKLMMVIGTSSPILSILSLIVEFLEEKNNSLHCPTAGNSFETAVEIARDI
jgi:hypothetical protein